MVKRGFVIVIGVVLLIAFVAQTTFADEPPGAKLFATYCQSCHGVAGKGGEARSIGSENFLNTFDDAAIAQVTSEGIISAGMPAWGKSKGGNLTDAQIDSIIAYLRVAALSPTSPAPAAPVVVVEFAQTKMTVSQTANAHGEVIVNALLQKNNDTPINGVMITFARVTSFGVIDLGTAKTDKTGTASVLIGDLPEIARQVNVNFKGDKSLGSSEGKIVLQPPIVATSLDKINLKGVRLSVEDEPLLQPEGSLITPNPPLVPSAIFLSVLGCIWALYSFVIVQVVGIWRTGRNAPPKHLFPRRAR